MPYKSNAQRRYAHTPDGMKAMGGKKAVAEMDAMSRGKKMPEHAKPKPVARKAKAKTKR